MTFVRYSLNLAASVMMCSTIRLGPWQRRPPGDPSRRENDRRQHERGLHQLGRPVAEARDEPENAERTQDETSTEYEREVERAGLQDPHYS